MFRKKSHRRFLFYFLFALFIFWIIIEPSIKLTYRDGFIIVLLVIHIHSLIDNQFLYNKLNKKYLDSNDLFNNLFRNCPDLVFRKDCNLKYIDGNPVMKKMLNFDSTRSISNKNDYDFYSKETADIIRGYDKEVMEKKCVVHYKIEKKRFSGETKIYETILSPIITNGKITGLMGISRDITPVEKMKERILIQNAQLFSIIDNMPFLIYMKDLDGRVIACNSRLEKHLGIARDEIIGMQPGINFCKGYLNQIICEDEKVIKTKMSISTIIQSSMFTVKPSWYQITKSPIIDLQKDVIGIIVTIENIDKEKELEEQKDTLVATITHDLKTPTTAQMTAMNLLEGNSFGILTEEQKEIVKLAKDSNIYMSNMISTILATYKSESGEIILEPETFDIEELVITTKNELSILSLTKNQKLIVESQSLSDKMITADKLQLKRVIMNFISNAITYGFEGTEIVMELKETDSGIAFDITNKGHFINKDKLKDIFEKYKTKENAKFNKASTGLGLYLSREIVRKHNGDVHADSFENQTCVFGFKIPRVFQKKDSLEQEKGRRV